MELDNIKLQTTWNDAAGSINNNFSKIKQAIAALVVEGGGLDEEQLLEYLVDNGYVTQEWINENGYIKEVTKKMIADSLGSTGNAGKFLMSTDGDVVWTEVDAEQDTPDWDAAEGETGYVKNRPFYADWKYKGENIEVTSDTPVTIEGAVSIGVQDYICATIFANGATKYLASRFDHFDGSVSITINGVRVTFEKNTYTDTVTISTSSSTALVEEFKTASSIFPIAEMYLPENLAKLDEDCVVAKGIVNQDDVYYYLPNNAPENDADHTLATQGWVKDQGYLTSADIGEQGRTPVLESWDDYDAETSKGYALGANLGYEYIKGVSDILDEINGSTVVAVDEINGEII